MPEQNERSFLEERKAEYLAELRRREPELTVKFLRVSAAIDAMDSMGSTEETLPPDNAGDAGAYSDPELSKPLYAIAVFLDKEGGPVTRERIADSLEDGGWGKGRVQRPTYSLRAMFDYYLGTKDKSKPAKSTSKDIPIKEINGLVGRVEWPNEVFRPSPAPQAQDSRRINDWLDSVEERKDKRADTTEEDPEEPSKD